MLSGLGGLVRLIVNFTYKFNEINKQPLAPGQRRFQIVDLSGQFLKGFCVLSVRTVLFSV